MAALLAVVATVAFMYARACESERQRIGGHRFTLLAKPSLWQALSGGSHFKS